MPTELKEIQDILFECLEECSDNHELKFDIHQKFSKRIDFNFNKKPIYSEQEVRNKVKQLKNFIGNSRFTISNKSLKELYFKINELWKED